MPRVTKNAFQVRLHMGDSKGRPVKRNQKKTPTTNTFELYGDLNAKIGVKTGERPHCTTWWGWSYVIRRTSLREAQKHDGAFSWCISRRQLASIVAPWAIPSRIAPSATMLEKRDVKWMSAKMKVGILPIKYQRLEARIKATSYIQE
ncbi:hypothetical protein R3P38DRAFT_2785793 [Favolaschia claudopus]|uniref:Uncharacterized protein n=1 Tax=Favolaschia claudopus TaxID=2862362 RepID=A0AAW0AWQ0_9AGAR